MGQDRWENRQSQRVTFGPCEEKDPSQCGLISIFLHFLVITGGGCRIRKAYSGRNPRWPRSLPVWNPWVHNGTGQWERDSQTGWITVSLSGCTLTFQAFVKATPFLTHMRTPPFSSTLLSPLKSLLYVLFMISGPFLFRVSVHNSAVYVIYDARNNLNHIRSLNIIGALESYIFLVMVKLRQW